MPSLTMEWGALVALVFLLGMRHGVDADHLAAIDGLTRFNSTKHRLVSKFSGLLFSIGHGLVVTLVAVLVATVAQGWQTPEWLEHTGAWISIVFLLVLGALNLRAVWITPAHEVVRVASLRGKFMGRFSQTSHPFMIAAVGAAFALSFDTISQTVMFAMSGSQLYGWIASAALGLVFTLGMVITDSLNGFFVSHLFGRADRRAAQLSRVMSLCVAIISLSIAAWGAMRYLFPETREALESVTAMLSPLILLMLPLALLGGGWWLGRAATAAK